MGADEGVKLPVRMNGAVAERYDIGVVELAFFGKLDQTRSDGHAISE
jgi:hypothetical protein